MISPVCMKCCRAVIHGPWKRMILPDLIMVDGGKGQLNIAQAVLWELGIEAPDLISIAKSRLKPVRGSEEKHRTDERFLHSWPQEPRHSAGQFPGIVPVAAGPGRSASLCHHLSQESSRQSCRAFGSR